MRTSALWFALCLITSFPGNVWADGKVFAEPQVRLQVDIPQQQALIHFENGVERLVIETAFLSEGTNFAWVVPLPAPPQIQAVAPDFFLALQRMFQPRLWHHVRPYYVPVLFVLGLGLLGWRAMQDEVSWVKDLPLCLLLAAGLGWATRSWWVAGGALAFALMARVSIRSPISYAVVLLIELFFMVWLTVGYSLVNFGGIVETMGSSGAVPSEVEIVSVQHAGLFESTVIRSKQPDAIVQWLERNGFAASPAIQPVVRDYVDRGWVFVASKARRSDASLNLTALHPLAFTFSTATPVYPLQLTGVENGRCRIDLFVFGDRRATAPHFRAARCDRIATKDARTAQKPWQSWLKLNHHEVAAFIGPATVGTKLTGNLQPRQMQSDAIISWRRFSSKGATVFSRAGAGAVTLNVILPLLAIAWLTVGGFPDQRRLWCWRRRVLIGAALAGIILYWYLPKAEVVGAI